MNFNFIEVLIFFICIYLLFSVIRLNGRNKGLKYTMDQISKQMNVTDNPLNNELRQLLNEGNDIKAVKRTRETLGLSLIEAKQYVDAFRDQSDR